MKKLFVFLLLGLIAASARAQEINQTCAELRLSTGRVLVNTRVTLFDGLNFHIENSNGVTQVPWASMPAEWREKFKLDPKRALWVEKEKQRKAKYSNPAYHYQQLSAAAPSSDKPARSQFGTLMELPRHNLDTTLEHLKPGISAEKVTRILGNPIRVNGSQWVYPTGYVYVENGVLVALQNGSGRVFAHGSPAE